MRKKIGEVLVEQGLITKAQLDKALQAQLILGGHLGTCLVELSYVNEQSFGRALAELVGLRYASPDMLRGIPPEVTRILTRKVVERCQAVPMRLEDKTLHVAVVDPKKLASLSSTTGYRIVPWIAPEIRIFEAMELYYYVPRRPRYIALCRELDRLREPPGRATPAAREREASPPTASAPIRRAGETAEDLGVDLGYGKSWHEVASELFGEESRDEGRGASDDLGRCLDLMSGALDKNQLAEAVLDYTSRHMATSVLFVVRQTLAAVWDWRGVTLNAARVAGARFPVTGGSIFSLLLGDDHYRGPVPDRIDVKWFYSALQLEVPRELMLVPSYLNDRLVAILYGDGGPEGHIAGDTAIYQRLAQKLGLALNVIILRKKIRAV